MNVSAPIYQRFIEPMEERMIRSVWRVTRNAQDAEDAMQNALAAIWKHRHRLAQHPSPQALILRICVDASYDVLRKRGRLRRQSEPVESAENVADKVPLPLEELARQETAEEIVTAINRLSQCQAVAIVLRAFEDFSYDQIAAAMNCTAATARKHAERARAQLRVILAKHRPLPISRSP